MISPSKTIFALAFLRRQAVPLAAFLLLAFAGEFLVGPAPAGARQGVLAKLLGHQLNTLFVAVSVLLMTVPAIVAWRRKETERSGWWLWDAIVADLVIVDGLGKSHLTAWHRPNDFTKPGFPSGHATFAFALAYVVWMRYPRLGPWWFGCAVAISLSRLVSNAHYPYQVCGGALFGILVGYLTTHLELGIALPRIYLPRLWARDEDGVIS